MTKAEFFHNLEEKLRGLPESERRNIMAIYEDLFEKAAENGKSEQEIARSLGHGPHYTTEPTLPVQTYPSTRGKETFPSYRQPSSGAGDPAWQAGLRGTVALVALAFFNLVFVLGPFAAVSAVLFAFCIVSLVLATSPLWIVMGSGIPDSLPALQLEIFGSLMLGGLGVLLCLALIRVVRAYVWAVKKYFTLNIRLIRGK